MTSDSENDEPIGTRGVVWRGHDFESEVQPRLEKLISTLDPCDDAQLVYIAYAHREGRFVIAWDIWLPPGPDEVSENPDDPPAHMETWYRCARVLERSTGWLTPPGLDVEVVGGLTRAKDYGDATHRIEAEFDELSELVID